MSSKLKHIPNVKDKKTGFIYIAHVRYRFHDAQKKFKKGMQHEDFPGGNPSWYYSRPSTLNFGVLMGSGALVLVWSHPLTLAIQLYMCFL